MELEERIIQFRKHVAEVGGTIYTKRCLDEFTSYWEEIDRGKKPKMRWEKEKTWVTLYRLRTWASRTRGYTVHLSEGQRTIAEKKRAFAITLEPFLSEYGNEFLNRFYAFWSQPENKQNPERLRWEAEDFWSVETRLKQWAERNLNTVKR